MPQRLVWECPKSGRLFRERESYVSYLRKTARTRINAIKRERRKNDAKAEITKRLSQVTSFEEYAEFLSKHCALAHVAITGNSIRGSTIALSNIEFDNPRHHWDLERFADVNAWSGHGAAASRMIRKHGLGDNGRSGWVGVVRIKISGTNQASYWREAFLAELGLYLDYAYDCFVISDQCIPGLAAMARLDGTID